MSFYKVEKQTLEAVFRYLRRQPHEEVDVLLHAIKANTEGPLEEPTPAPHRGRPRGNKAKSSPQPKTRPKPKI
jgi:hypothetical protein